jgi:hypothetical protein
MAASFLMDLMQSEPNNYYYYLSINECLFKSYSTKTIG